MCLRSVLGRPRHPRGAAPSEPQPQNPQPILSYHALPRFLSISAAFQSLPSSSRPLVPSSPPQLAPLASIPCRACVYLNPLAAWPLHRRREPQPQPRSRPPWRCQPPFQPRFFPPCTFGEMSWRPVVTSWSLHVCSLPPPTYILLMHLACFCPLDNFQRWHMPHDQFALGLPILARTTQV